jgi:hypothetical protein
MFVVESLVFFILQLIVLYDILNVLEEPVSSIVRVPKTVDTHLPNFKASHARRPQQWHYVSVCHYSYVSSFALDNSAISRDLNLEID